VILKLLSIVTNQRFFHTYLVFAVLSTIQNISIYAETENDILNNTDMLDDMMADYNEAYNSSTDFSKVFVLQGILLIGGKWLVWVNNKEIDNKNPHIQIGRCSITIQNVTPHSITLKHDNDEIAVNVGKTYNINTHDITAF
jgi:hypothetical protein